MGQQQNPDDAVGDLLIQELVADESLLLPRPIVPVFQNTCYPPNTPSAKRSYQLGQAIAGAVSEYPEDARVAVVASGGLSHFVVDEDQDRRLLKALADILGPYLTKVAVDQQTAGPGSIHAHAIAVDSAM